MSKSIANNDYKDFLIQVKTQIRSSQAKAALAVNSSLIYLYWNIGKLIAEKQEAYSWGNSVIETLSEDLKNEFPDSSGFSARNLFDVRRFYLFYSNEKVQQLVALLNFPEVRQVAALIPWGHHVLILNKTKDPSAALFYIQQTIEYNWSRAVLGMQMEQDLYARQGKAINNFKTTLQEHQAILAQQMLKDPYNFGFLTQARIQCNCL